MEFRRDGSLTYTVPGDKREGKIFLTYEVEGNVLITDQPSEPRKEETQFRLTDDGKLVLIRDGQESKFIRA